MSYHEIRTRMFAAEYDAKLAELQVEGDRALARFVRLTDRDETLKATDPELDEEGLSWADRKFGKAVNGRRRRVSYGIKIRHTLKGDCHDYREDLARSKKEFMADPTTPRNWNPKKGDPQAHVDGPGAVKKLIDKRKREGWVERNETWDDLERAIPTSDVPEVDRDSEEILRECEDRAIAEVKRGGVSE